MMVSEAERRRNLMTLRAWWDKGRKRVRVKAGRRMLGRGVPDDARPGDIVLGNRGAAAQVCDTGSVLHLEHIGNIGGSHVRRYAMGCRRVYDFR